MHNLLLQAGYVAGSANFGPRCMVQSKGMQAWSRHFKPHHYCRWLLRLACRESERTESGGISWVAYSAKVMRTASASGKALISCFRVAKQPLNSPAAVMIALTNSPTSTGHVIVPILHSWKGTSYSTCLDECLWEVLPQRSMW